MSEERRTERPVPDWREESDYPDPKTTRPEQWAWEFLRRNLDYRADWRRYAECCEALRVKYPEQLNPDMVEETEFAANQDPPDPLGCEEGEPLEAWLRKKWGLRIALVDPSGSFPGGMIWSQLWLTPRARRSALSPLSASTTYDYPFDFARPLQPQLDSAKRYLSQRQKSLQRRGLVGKGANSRAQDGKKYLRYLQVLDADDAGATESQIGETLFPQQYRRPDDRHSRDERVRGMIRAAKELRDIGYQRLPGLSTKNNTRR